ncbi:MAG: peptide deformylase [Candidatus Omnitrophica bacterium CG1_02_46_14]|nr:MAG: peptide deformylase [Candidatus Omnitrophica bacterium CG1_02_46_14]
MAVLPVVKFPDKVLKTRASEVFEITAEDRKLVKNMIDTMYVENGVGLAANQVGVLRRVFIASPDQIKGNERVYFNPVIVKKEGSTKEFEGCLSVPEFYEPVKRAKKVWMRAMTLDGKMVEVKAEGLLSRIFQHETDHLDGILFIDRLGIIKSKLTRSKLKKKSALSKE